MLGLLGLAGGAAASRLMHGKQSKEHKKTMRAQKEREEELASQVAKLEVNLRFAKDADAQNERVEELTRATEAIKVAGLAWWMIESN